MVMAPSKIFVSRLVSKKCRQDQKKLRRSISFPEMRPFSTKIDFINHQECLSVRHINC